jgi:LacI family transcriptional regulator
MKNRPRLADVAHLASVSTATVSAVINNTTGRNIRVSEETRQRVWDAVANLRYVANPAARILAGGENRVLGIFTYEPIFPFQHHDFFHPFLLGIEEEAEAQGYQLLLFTHVTNVNGLRSIYHDDTNLLYMANGSILLGLNENKNELRSLQEAGYPFVYVGRREVPGAAVSYVAGDYTSATTQLTRRLIELGHRRLLYVALPQRIESSQDREVGFVSACQQAGLAPQETRIEHIATADITVGTVRAWLAAGFTGALVEFDDQCQAILQALHALGLEVPQDFSMVMLGNPHYAWDHSLDWTMFTVPRREMGIQAVRMLVQRLSHPEDILPQCVYLPCGIVPGQTIASPHLSQLQ